MIHENNIMVGEDEMFYKRPLRFYIPDLERLAAPLYIYDILEKHKDCFIPNIRIEAIYGVFNGMLWNGGRGPKASYKRLEISQIAEIIAAINELGISVRFTTTNMLLEPKHLDDEFCNAIFHLANQSKINDALIASPVLYEYVKKTYPNIRLCKSIVNHVDSINELKHELDTYNWHTLVPACKLTLEQDFLDLEQDYKDHIEIMLNGCFGKKECCMRHYEHESRMNLEGKPDTPLDCLDTPHPYIQRHFNDYKGVRKTEIYRDELTHYFIKQGYSRFKIVGRERSPSGIVTAFLKYTLRDLQMTQYFIDKFERQV